MVTAQYPRDAERPEVEERPVPADGATVVQEIGGLRALDGSLWILERGWDATHGVAFV